MKYLFIRTQLLVVSIILLVTFGMTMAIVLRFNRRWDFTKEKIYSLSDSTVEILKQLSDKEIELLAFYPQDDPARANFELFLRESRMYHPRLSYRFYDPDRVPGFVKELRVKEVYTVILKSGGRQERLVGPTEERLASAMLRLANPKKFEACFVTGHDEASLNGEDRTGYRFFKEVLLDRNFNPREIILTQGGYPQDCHVLIVPGPHRDFDPSELEVLKRAFAEGRGIFFLIDPMDMGTGVSFQNFMRQFGIVIGGDVIVDKMSKMVGGDFLVPLVGQYISQHPITAKFDKPTMFPVARSVQPSTETKEGIEVVPLALSSSGSWAESNLKDLEQGQAVFEADTDLAGPIPVAVAAEKQSTKEQPGGRIVVVGDSDFLSNAYIRLQGNQDLALNMLEWLVRDDRFISIRPKQAEFQPLILNEKQQWNLFGVTLGLIPLGFLVSGASWLVVRRKQG